MGRWKGIRNNILTQPGAPLELYDLDRDRAEATNVAAANPDVVRRIEDVMQRAHTPAALPKWNFPRTSVQ